MGKVDGLRQRSGVWTAAFAIIIVAIVVFSCWEPRIRWAGGALQLLGLAQVVIGLRSKRKNFGLPSLPEKALAWLKEIRHRLSWRREQTVAVEARADVSLRADVARATAIVIPGKNASLEERVDALEKSVLGLHSADAQITKRVDDLNGSQQEDLRKERDEREEGDEENRMLIKKVEVGDLDIQWIGVVWLFFGIILSTGSNEIASLSIFAACPK